MSSIHTGDIVIVGSGLAGLFTALKLAPLPVTVISAMPLGTETSSAWAQGGIAAAISEGDSAEAHARDTIRAGAGLVDENVARLLTAEAPARIDDLLAYGVPFDRDLEGHLVQSREAAHSARRIIRVRGDMAGKAIMEAVTAAARNTPSIRILENYTAASLVKTGSRVTGVTLLPAGAAGTSTPFILPAKAVVLASGGIGHLYAVTTNPSHANGDGIAMAARAGAVIADAEFVQFHPTALDIGRDPAPLATEALRGEGARLINARGERFTVDVHPDAELAPRDIVARAVHTEIRAGRGAFLDCREAVGERFPEAFPAIYEVCRSAGLDPVTEPLPVAPAAHYHMGGILTDANGRSTVDGLWACGEVASTGAHGANRLASNSLLETVVFGARIAEDLKHLLPIDRFPPQHGLPPPAEPGEMPQQQSVTRLRTIMAADAGVVREQEALAHALKELKDIEKDAGNPAIANMALAARFVVASAWARKESRGGHYRSDYSETDPALARHSYLRLADLERIALQTDLQDEQPSNVIHAEFCS